MVTRTELNNGIKEGKIEVIEEQKNDEVVVEDTKPASETLPFKLEDYIATLQILRSTAKFLTVAPTFIPKSFVESIQFFDDGVDVRLYLYINSTWRYVILT